MTPTLQSELSSPGIAPAGAAGAIRCARIWPAAPQLRSIQVGTDVVSHNPYSQLTRQADPIIAPELRPTPSYTWPRNFGCCQNVEVERSYRFRVCSLVQAHTSKLKRRSVSRLIRPLVEIEGELIHSGCHVISTFTGISFLRGTVKNGRGGILKSESVDGVVPVTRCSFPWTTCCKARC